MSWFIAAQGHQIDPDYNDYLTSKWLVLIRPLVAGFHAPLTLRQQNWLSTAQLSKGFAAVGQRLSLLSHVDTHSALLAQIHAHLRSRH